MKIKKPLYINDKNLISFLLLPLTLFTLAINFLKSFSIKKQFKIKTICVGNIYVGGTGKTSLCIAINKILKKNYKTVFVKKMYKDQLDERKLLESYGKIFSDKNRSSSLEKAEKKFNLAILDDGLQDKKINYNVKIACFNTSYGIGNRFLLPAGPLRENISIIKDYNAIFLIGEKTNKKLSLFLRKFNDQLFYSKYLPLNLNQFDRKKKYLYFCGIGNPQEFRNTLKKYKFKISQKFEFPDHHNFKNEEIDEIKRIATEKKLEIVTTEKDYKRLSKKNKKNIKYLKIELKIQNIKKFTNFLKKII